MKTEKIIFEMTIEEAKALWDVAHCGWGDGDYEDICGKKAGRIIAKVSKRLKQAYQEAETKCEPKA